MIEAILRFFGYERIDRRRTCVICNKATEDSVQLPIKDGGRYYCHDCALKILRGARIEWMLNK